MIKKFDCVVCKLGFDSHTKLRNHYSNFHPGFQPEWSRASEMSIVGNVSETLGFFKPEDFMEFQGDKMSVGNATFVFNTRQKELARSFAILAAYTANALLSKHLKALPTVDLSEEKWRLTSGEIFPGASVAKVVKN